MRLGVSGKIFVAYAVLLAAFGGYAAYTGVTLHRARQRIVANRAYLDVRGAVDEAVRRLTDAPPPSNRPDPGLPIAFKASHQRLGEGQRTIERYLAADPPAARRVKFELLHRQVADFAERVNGLAALVGGAQAAAEPRARDDFTSRMATLLNHLRTLRRTLDNELGDIARHLAEDEEDSWTMALGLALSVLVVAGLVILAMWRTLHPLGVLRAHARQVAGGDYARRTGVGSRDEIGDLAREFDAMAAAIEEREHRLIRSERLATVGRMAAQITHEIRNPLASIGLYAELLGDETEGRAEARKLVESIVAEVDRLTEITETYLRFARLPRPKLEREDAAAIVASVAEFARAELSQTGIALEVAIEPGLPDIGADESQLRQALLNLVRNAREAMPSGGRLRVEVGRTAAGQVRIAVGDSGPGIAAEHLPRIFDPFFSTKDKGTGLGLALVQQIVAEHGGRIEVASEPGHGTTFSIAMPALPSRPAGETAPAAATGAPGETDGPAAAPKSTH